jgi:hypothetical protein
VGKRFGVAEEVRADHDESEIPGEESFLIWPKLSALEQLEIVQPPFRHLLSCPGSQIRLLLCLANPANLRARVAGAEEDGYQDDEGAGFDEEFAAVEPVDGGAFQVRIGEEGVPEEGGGAEVDGEVERFPDAAAQLNAKVRGDDHDRDDVEGDGADGVFKGLLRGVHGVNEVEDAELWRFVEEQSEGMEDGDD